MSQVKSKVRIWAVCLAIGLTAWAQNAERPGERKPGAITGGRAHGVPTPPGPEEPNPNLSTTSAPRAARAYVHVGVSGYEAAIDSQDGKFAHSKFTARAESNRSNQQQ